MEMGFAIVLVILISYSPKLHSVMLLPVVVYFSLSLSVCPRRVIGLDLGLVSQSCPPACFSSVLSFGYFYRLLVYSPISDYLEVYP